MITLNGLNETYDIFVNNKTLSLYLRYDKLDDIIYWLFEKTFKGTTIDVVFAHVMSDKIIVVAPYLDALQA